MQRPSGKRRCWLPRRTRSKRHASEEYAMNIHEYQTKDLLKHYGVPVPEGRVVHTDEQAVSVAEEIGGSRWIVKAQIHSGGRGKAGGVKVVSSVDDVRA